MSKSISFRSLPLNELPIAAREGVLLPLPPTYNGWTAVNTSSFFSWTEVTTVVAPSSTPYVKSSSSIESSYLYSDGFWTHNTWYSFLYTNQWTNATDFQNCLRNKHLILLGDSTTRQWAENSGIPYLLHLVNGIYREEVPNIFFENEYPQINLTVSYRFHPQTITAERAPFRLYRYFVDILDSIPTDECSKTIVVLSPWAHFVQWTRDSYTQRLVKLKEAVNRLRTRCRTIPIIVKGCHLREHVINTAKWGWSDYLLKQMNEIMKETFNGTGTWFLDVWDMNLSYPSKKFIHMPTYVVHEEIKLALSYICKRWHFRVSSIIIKSVSTTGSCPLQHARIYITRMLRTHT